MMMARQTLTSRACACEGINAVMHVYRTYECNSHGSDARFICYSCDPSFLSDVFCLSVNKFGALFIFLGVSE